MYTYNRVRNKSGHLLLQVGIAASGPVKPALTRPVSLSGRGQRRPGTNSLWRPHSKSPLGTQIQYTENSIAWIKSKNLPSRRTQRVPFFRVGGDPLLVTLGKISCTSLTYSSWFLQMIWKILLYMYQKSLRILLSWCRKC